MADVTLENALSAITDALVATLRADVTLADVKAVVKGNKFRVIPADPFIAVHTLHVQVADKSMSLSQKWDGYFGVVCFVKLVDVEQDYFKPTSLASRAMSALTSRPKLGIPSIVWNVEPDSIVPEDEKWKDIARTITVCSAIVKVEFKTFESRRA